MAGFNFAALDRQIRDQPDYASGFILMCEEIAASIDENAENPKDLRNLAFNLRKQAETIGRGIFHLSTRPDFLSPQKSFGPPARGSFDLPAGPDGPFAAQRAFQVAPPSCGNPPEFATGEPLAFGPPPDRSPEPTNPFGSTNPKGDPIQPPPQPPAVNTPDSPTPEKVSKQE